MEGPLCWLEDVGVRGIQAEVAAAVLVMDARRWVHDTGPESEVVRFDEADRVAVVIDDREVFREMNQRLGAA